MNYERRRDPRRPHRHVFQLVHHVAGGTDVALEFGDLGLEILSVASDPLEQGRRAALLVVSALWWFLLGGGSSAGTHQAALRLRAERRVRSVDVIDVADMLGSAGGGGAILARV